MSANKKRKVESAAMSIRFSGKQELDLHKSITAIVEHTGKSENSVMKYLMQLGLAWHNKGAVAGIDGKVILPPDDGAVIAKASNPVVVESTNNPVQERKRSTFLD